MIIKKKVDGVYLRNRNSVRHESDYFAGIEIKSNESFIDALCRIIPAKQRALMGLSIKMIALKISEMNGRHIDEIEKINVENEINRLRNMTNEEYDLEQLRSNNANVSVEYNTNKDNNKIIESFQEAGVSLKDENGDFISTYDALKRISEKYNMNG